MTAGRFAPSPSGPMHLGNLRTALVAWALARQSGRSFYLRIDDIDPGRDRGAESQIRDLEALGIDWDGPVIYQSQRRDLYEQALDDLRGQAHIFYCYCSRKEIREAVRAPHVLPTQYPGTCLTKVDPPERNGRSPAIRLKPPPTAVRIDDRFVGPYEGAVDALVLRRGDGWPAYNLASVVDDIDLGVDQVVRGDDLLDSSPAQLYLGQLLSNWKPEFVHIPLVLNEDGKRLAKRDGAVTMSDIGLVSADVLRVLAESLGVSECVSPEDFVARFDLQNVDRKPVSYHRTEPGTAPRWAIGPIMLPNDRIL